MLKTNDMHTKTFFKTIVLSDLHLGSDHAKIAQLVEFLRSVNCSTLLLNGDIIDGWKLQKGGRWKREYSELIKIIMKMMENHGTKVVYIRGNHDDFIDHFAPFFFQNLSIVKDYVYQSGSRNYYVCHGDVFDGVSSRMIWLAKLGDMGYSLLLHINKVYNKVREKKGLPYFSLSQSIKQKVKSTISYISDFEKELVSLARSRGMDGVICGHIHKPANEVVNGIHYLNSGDWVETMSALLEHEDGRWEVYMHTQSSIQTLAIQQLLLSNEVSHKPELDSFFL